MSRKLGAIHLGLEVHEFQHQYGVEFAVSLLWQGQKQCGDAALGDLKTASCYSGSAIIAKVESNDFLHWTVIRSIETNLIKCFDSAGQGSLNLGNGGVGVEYAARQWMIDPSDTIVIVLKNGPYNRI